MLIKKGSLFKYFSFITISILLAAVTFLIRDADMKYDEMLAELKKRKEKRLIENTYSKLEQSLRNEDLEFISENIDALSKGRNYFCNNSLHLIVQYRKLELLEHFIVRGKLNLWELNCRGLAPSYYCGQEKECLDQIKSLQSQYKQ